jgi:hypothetical protein
MKEQMNANLNHSDDHKALIKTLEKTVNALSAFTHVYYKEPFLEDNNYAAALVSPDDSLELLRRIAGSQVSCSLILLAPHATAMHAECVVQHPDDSHSRRPGYL